VTSNVGFENKRLNSVTVLRQELEKQHIQDRNQAGSLV
jgi:hypothetical protein